MEIDILKEEKESIEVEIASLTLVEILRVYLNKDADVKFAAWKREHPTKNPVLKIESKNPKKSLKGAIASVTKDLDKVEKEFSKLS
jgi:DNA-directed RNA polymerase subunit L